MCIKLFFRFRRTLLSRGVLNYREVRILRNVNLEVLQFKPLHVDEICCPNELNFLQFTFIKRKLRLTSAWPNDGKLTDPWFSTHVMASESSSASLPTRVTRTLPGETAAHWTLNPASWKYCEHSTKYCSKESSSVIVVSKSTRTSTYPVWSKTISSGTQKNNRENWDVRTVWSYNHY